MTVAAGSRHTEATAGSFATLFRMGMHELRSGIGGFKIFISCLALGVMVIAAVGALADALTAGFERQGRVILGGDFTFSRMHRPAAAEERAHFETLGRVSETATMRTMGRRLDGEEQALIELKAVDSAYPLVGDVTMADDARFRAAMDAGGAVADSMLLERLGVKPGERIRIGKAEIEVRGLLKAEPDGIADRLSYGPRVFVSLATLEATGLAAPGSLVKWRYAVDRGNAANETREELNSIERQSQAALPEAGFTVRDRTNPSPQVTRTLDRLRQFLILIGLASLLVGGIGIANAVATFIDKRIKVIATLRSVGATGRQITMLFLVQILAMTALGIGIGLGLGMLIPGIIDWALGEALPIRTQFSVSPESLALATAYGLLVALLFTLWPLGKAERVRASVLFRETEGSHKEWPRTSLIAATVGLALALFVLALVTSEPRLLAVYAAASMAAILAVFAGLGTLLTRLARRAPRSGRPELDIAVRNVGAPDGLTRSVILSLGTGLSLLVGVALINASLVEELKGRLPENSPDYFLLDIPKPDYEPLARRVASLVPGAELTEAPMLRGRLVKLKGKPVEDLKVPAEAQWVLNGDRGLSYSDEVPEGSKVTQGTWWAEGYDGPPLVSFEADLAEKFDLKIGDSVTVNILGHNVDATVANLREVKWENLAINFVMVFSPNTLQSSPHNLLATIRMPDKTSKEAEVAMVRDIGKSFPAVSAIRVRDAINQFNKIFDKVMTAVQVAGGVTLAAGALVLAGALATAQRRRILEAVILKTVGATRRQILGAHAAEYALLAVAAAAIAVLLGSLAAWAALQWFLETEFTFAPSAVLRTLAIAAGLIAVFGGAGTWSVLRAPPVPYLRSE